MAEQPLGQGPVKNPDQDHHMTFTRALRRILQEAPIENESIERLEVFIHASGDLTYRYWFPRAEDSEGGWLPPE